MNNSNIHVMNKKFKTIASAIVTFALVLSIFAAPVSKAIAVTQFDSQFGFDTSLDLGETLSYFSNGTADSNQSGETVVESNSSFTECALEASRNLVTIGESITLYWNTSGFSSITINGQSVSGNSGSMIIGNLRENTSFTLEALNNSGSKCTQQVLITCVPPEVPKECELLVEKSVDKATALPGEKLTYTIKVQNIGDADCTGDGVRIEDVIDANLIYESYQLTSNLSAGYGTNPVYTTADRTLHFNGNVLTPGEYGTITWIGKVNNPTQCGDFEVKNQAKATAKELNNFQTFVYSQTVKTLIDNDCVVVDPAPTCDSFTANPGLIKAGASSTLTWQTSNATQVFINNGIGTVALDGSISVTPLADIVYKLTVIGTKDRVVNCEVPVKVSADEVPVCERFTATPNTLPNGGGNVALNWSVLKADTVTISPTVGAVSLVGSQSVNVTQSTNFVLTATDNNGDKVTCPAPVVVRDPVTEVFSCENNVSFSASETSIRRGDNLTLSWSTTNVDSVSISGINATTLSGSQNVSPSNDITYTLTATKGIKTVNCPVSVGVSSGGGGGGGGSPTPRCSLDISDTKIKLGEQITLKWDTSNATEVTLTDDRGKVIFTTDDYLAGDKVDYFDSSIKVKPTRDTKYTLLAERGSRDKECEVEVEIEDKVVVLQTRDQQPLVAGISLSQVPYTGFDAGPFMTIMFYVLLIAWALYISYLLVIRKQATSNGVSMTDTPVVSHENIEAMKKAVTKRPDAFVTAITVNPAPANLSPRDLPTGVPTIGYENHVEEPIMVNPHQVNDVVVTKLENRAHSQKALLSSDAVRHFVGTTTNEEERNLALDEVIREAKKTYPLEDGWIVINESRMQNLCAACKVNSVASAAAPFVPATVPKGAGSLAEAIVTGNVVAAYAMIGNRPMFALADAAADLDAIYRNRQGGVAQVSDMLIAETKDLSDEKIKNMIDALTGAIDGTYTDEASAVKMAIMKAVKEAA